MVIELLVDTWCTKCIVLASHESKALSRLRIGREFIWEAVRGPFMSTAYMTAAMESFFAKWWAVNWVGRNIERLQVPLKSAAHDVLNVY